MKCPKCGRETDVHVHEIDGEEIEIYRCDECEEEFVTEEEIKKLKEETQKKLRKWASENEVKVR